MIPAVIEYKVQGNVLYPLVYADLSQLMDDYDSYMIGIKQVRRGKRKRGA